MATHKNKYKTLFNDIQLKANKQHEEAIQLLENKTEDRSNIILPSLKHVMDLIIHILKK